VATFFFIEEAYRGKSYVSLSNFGEADMAQRYPRSCLAQEPIIK